MARTSGWHGLKTFPAEAELRALAAPFAKACDFRRLDNFWMLEYEIESAPGLPGAPT